MALNPSLSMSAPFTRKTSPCWSSYRFQIVLGFPWLRALDPRISWKECQKKKSHAGQSIVMLIVFSCPLFRWHLSPSKVQNPETPLSYSKSTKSIKRYSAKPRLVACLHIAPMTVQLDYWLVLCPRATVSTPAYQGNTGYGGIH